jgi:hypothetical protein
MKNLLQFAVLAVLITAAVPALAQDSGQNKAVHDWNTNAFAKTPSANTNAFATTPNANTNAFAHTPPANTNAFGTENGGKVTAFGGDQGQTKNAFGNDVTATNNAHRLANSFGTNTDRNASPVMPNGPVQPGQGPLSGSGR